MSDLMATIETLIECCDQCSRYFDTHRAVESERFDGLVRRLLKELECLPPRQREDKAVVGLHKVLDELFRLNRWYLTGRSGQPGEREFVCTTPTHFNNDGQPDFIGTDFAYHGSARALFRSSAYTAYRVIPPTFTDGLRLALRLLRTDTADAAPAAGVDGHTAVRSCWWRWVPCGGFSVVLIVTFVCFLHLLPWNWAACSGLSAALIVFLLWCIHCLPWAWMRDHKNTVPIQITACLLIVMGSVGLFFPAYREWVGGGGGLGVAALVVLILNKLS